MRLVPKEVSYRTLLSPARRIDNLSAGQARPRPARLPRPKALGKRRKVEPCGGYLKLDLGISCGPRLIPAQALIANNLQEVCLTHGFCRPR